MKVERHYKSFIHVPYAMPGKTWMQISEEDWDKLFCLLTEEQKAALGGVEVVSGSGGSWAGPM